LSNLLFKAIKGISCETGDAFFNARSYQTTIIPAEILFPDIGDFIDPATDQKGDAMAKSNYQFKKRQKELANELGTLFPTVNNLSNFLLLRFSNSPWADVLIPNPDKPEK